MTSINKMSNVNADSEMEEGEIVDELDDLSDISSEEEFLLRQRLEVLENYNNVLERKKAKRCTPGSGIRNSRDILCDLSDISTAEMEHSPHKAVKVLKYDKYIKPKHQHIFEQNDNFYKRKKEHRKKTRSKKRIGVKIVSESSDESEDEYRNKRKKLADAVLVDRGSTKKTDSTSLSARLKKMIHSDTFLPVIDKNTNDDKSVVKEIEIVSVDQTNITNSVPTEQIPDAVEISTDDDHKMIINEQQSIPLNMVIEKDSEDDLELLRQYALNTKSAKPTKTNENNQQNIQTQHKTLSEDEDSDTAELRLICLKSALLKKAIEMKQKQKLRKRLSQSTTLDDDLFNDCNIYSTKDDADNNTDIESVDMEIVSEGEDKQKNLTDKKIQNDELMISYNSIDNGKGNNLSTVKEDEIEEDEDLLRAKLLTSLSKNLPNLVSPEILKEVDKEDKKVVDTKKPSKNVPEGKRFIIKLDETDSEGEHEATKNLKKMHVKLSEQIDFQQKLDMFLKTTRMEVEKAKLPDVVQPQLDAKKPQKFVAKAVNHLPKPEQIEYKNLVRRMAELEKLKQTRQAAMTMINSVPVKDTLKPRNVTIDAAQINKDIEEQISLSRKKIAEESSKMLKLKEEANKLSQRYKIAATELRNITTAITLNKKQQRSVQNCLAKIRLQHQSLLKSSPNSLHSKVNNRIPNLSNLTTKVVNSNRLQKENFPKDEYKNPIAQKTVKVSVVNNLKCDQNDTSTRLSVQIDVANNKKVIKVTKSPEKDKRVMNDCPESSVERDLIIDFCDSNNDKEERFQCNEQLNQESTRHSSDYISPLDALGVNTWKADPNAILCPFEVGGQCKDPDCKYLHTPTL